MSPSSVRNRRNKTEPDTVRRTRFFDAFDKEFPATSLAELCRRDEPAIHPSTGRKWLQQRKSLGRDAYRRTRPQSGGLGRPLILREETLDELLDSNDEAHNKPYDKIIRMKNLNVALSTL